MLDFDDHRPALTDKQRNVYEFIRDGIFNRGYGPTVREICAYCGYSSPNAAFGYLLALEKKGYITREANMSRAIELIHGPGERMTLPLAGVISAGKPVLANELTERVDFGALFNPETHFCLKVKGHSLNSEKIGDGDYVIFNEVEKARKGDIVLASINEKEVTLNRYFKEKKRVRLEFLNKKKKPIISDSVEIKGVLSGVFRSIG